MGLNKSDRSSVIKIAESHGYSWNSAGTKMINGNGGSLSFSNTCHSVKLNGSSYNSVAGTKKSSKW